ncbi:hypothetical protein IT568_00500 [bacterium]|nr:hypothetical protein [bacterium]
MKKVLSCFIVFLICCVSIELTFRIFFAFKIGTDIIFYGTRFCGQHKKEQEKQAKFEENHSVMFHKNSVGNYSKYFPNQNRKDKDENGEVFEVVINGKGFRGRDFQTKKEEGTTRIVTLGASSTFGYYDRENETYPFYLEKMLNEKFPQKHFEVINLGIPHLKSENILSLFEKEALELKPDFVTFYEGINDAASAEKKKPMFGFLPEKLQGRFMALAFVESMLTYNVETFSQQDFEKHLTGKSQIFLSNLEKINELCKENRIIFLLANQQAKSETIPKDKLQGITYEQETEQILQKLKTQNKISANELYFLTHSVLMKDLEKFASENKIPLVNVIESLNQNRHYLTSWVHLNPKANKIVAGTFYEKIVLLIKN